MNSWSEGYARSASKYLTKTGTNTITIFGVRGGGGVLVGGLIKKHIQDPGILDPDI